MANLTVAEFWRQQDFAYLETYSFNRGPKLEALRLACKAELERTRQQMLAVPSEQLPFLRERLRQLERTNDLSLLPLTIELTSFHITAAPVAIVRPGEAVAKQLATVLQLPIDEQMDWMCAPVYRDALAFYNERHQLMRVLNICFACDRMLTDNGVEIQANSQTYKQLRMLLERLGHPTAEEDAAEQERLRRR